MAERVPLRDISSLTWEHPADAAALQSLRAVPGFDAVLRAVFGLFAERTLRLMHLGGSVEVSPKQLSQINRVYEEVLGTLDAPRRYPLYVTQNPVLNAGAVGMEEPFIVLNSGAVALLSPDELRYVLGHEVGHILSDHVLYKTMVRLLLTIGRVAWSNVFTGIAYYGVLVALLEWDRKSELSSDRAGLLAVQDPDVVRLGLLRAAGGVIDGVDVEAFREQARRYEEGGDNLDSLAKALALLGRTHPMPVHRLQEIDRWVERGDYGRVLGGEYLRRSDQTRRPTAWETWRQSASSYADGFRASADPLTSWVRGKGDAAATSAGSAVDWLRRKGRAKPEGEGNE